MSLLRCGIVSGLILVLGLGLQSRAGAQGQAHQVAGIGAVVGGDDPATHGMHGLSRIQKFLEVKKVISHSPAEKAGIIAGDEIVEVDGEKLAGLMLIDAVENHLRGPLGSLVKLTVLRPGETAPRTLVLVRDIVPLPEKKT